MVTPSASGKLNANESETPLQHIIFKICLQCHYNTLRPSECAPSNTYGPGHRCPECQKSSFVAACTICRFESSSECPLTQLFNRRPKVVHERRGRERYRRGDHAGIETDPSISRSPVPRRLNPCLKESLEGPEMKKQCQDILKQFKRNGGKMHTASQTKKSYSKLGSRSPERLPGPPWTSSPSRLNIPDSKPHSPPPPNSTKHPQPPTPPKELPTPAETPRTLCTQCGQARCSTCNPGYMNLVIDMKEFSITFASEMALCTMCEHWLCPGSSLVVLYRCRDCGHEGCNGCATNDDGLGEEWVVCCCCAKAKGGDE